jgi:hypothetical protein
MLALDLVRATRSEALQIIASAIQLDGNLKRLVLHMMTGFTDEAGVALAEALTVNTTLRNLDLYTTVEHNIDSLRVPAYEALTATVESSYAVVDRLYAK